MSAGGGEEEAGEPDTPKPKPRPKSVRPATTSRLLALADEPELIAAVRRDLEAVGLVGEENAGLLVWLAYSSRKLDNPVSVIVQGPTGSGKDAIQRTPARLIPPEDVIEATSLTPQALYYGPPGHLKRKVLLGGERAHEDNDAQRDKTAAVRQMLSQGYITKQTVRDGETVSIRQDGPMAYSETTTKRDVFAEDDNRCLTVSPNPDPEQTKRVLLAKAGRYLGGADRSGERERRVIARHHRFQASLAPVAVVIPFAAELAARMPTGRPEVRRVFGHVLSLVEVIAFVHQHHRPRRPGGVVGAMAADYALARELLLGPLHNLLGLGRDHAKLRAFAAKLPSGTFSTEQAGKALDSSGRKVTLTWLNKLVTAGVVECVAEGKGNVPARWRTTGADADEAVLPPVGAVCVPA